MLSPRVSHASFTPGDFAETVTPIYKGETEAEAKSLVQGEPVSKRTGIDPMCLSPKTDVTLPPSGVKDGDSDEDTGGPIGGP